MAGVAGRFLRRYKVYIYTHIRRGRSTIVQPTMDTKEEDSVPGQIQEQLLGKENAINRVSGRWEGGAEPLTSGVVSIRSWGTERDERHRCAGHFQAGGPLSRSFIPHRKGALA